MRISDVSSDVCSSDLLGARSQALLSGGDLIVEDAATARLARQLLDGNLATPVVGDIQVALADITVVIPVRDRVAQLDRCLAALAPLQEIGSASCRESVCQSV